MPKGHYPRRKHTAKQLAERQAKRRAERDGLAQSDNPNQIVDIPAWAKLAGLSYSGAMRKLFVTKDGPPPLRISKHRWGIRLGDHVRWMERLAKAS
jgi:hypothetical protein